MTTSKNIELSLSSPVLVCPPVGIFIADSTQEVISADAGHSLIVTSAAERTL
jgi:hypothetical protein